VKKIKFGNDTGFLLGEERQRLGLSQEELSRRTGLSSHTISLIECGKRAPRCDSLERLANSLGLVVEIGGQS
jgi:transcriptional regulator with XRE-family HTH domain